MPENPYSSPMVDDSEVSRERSSPPPFVNSLGLWSLLSAIAAAPSFSLGIGCSDEPLAIPMMVTGIGVYALLLTMIRTSDVGHNVLTHPSLETSFRIAYGLRILLSIIFPFGQFNDMLVGNFSCQLTESIFSGTARGGDMSELQVLATTLVQGLLLNVEIGVWFVLLLPFAYLRRRMRQRSH